MSTLMGRSLKISVMMMTPQGDHQVEVEEMRVWMMTGHLLIPEKQIPDLADIRVL